MRFESRWLHQGKSFTQYMDEATMNKPTMRQNFRETKVPDEEHGYFHWLSSTLTPGSIKILAISESWCGDCVENLPIVAKLASIYPCFELMVFSRDDNLEIMDKFLTLGKRTIPVFVFFHESGDEIGRFVERPKAASDFLLRERARLSTMSEKEEQRAEYAARTKLRRLYKSSFRHETIKEIRRILEQRYGPQNSRHS